MPTIGSFGEEEFALHCRIYGLEPEREAPFHPGRKWRVDFLFRHSRLAVEIEGGTWANGRHNRGSGYIKDVEKYNALTMAGFRLLRYTPEMVHAGTAIDEVKAALGA